MGKENAGLKRWEVIALRTDEKGILILGTAHNEKERLKLCFKALINGYDYINFMHY